MIGKAANGHWMAATVCAVVVAALGYVLQDYGVGLWLRQRSYDLLTVGRGEIPAEEAVIVFLDELSHAKLSQPYNAAWDRSLHARLIRRRPR